jgi:hypothetical protein
MSITGTEKAKLVPFVGIQRIEKNYFQQKQGAVLGMVMQMMGAAVGNNRTEAHNNSNPDEVVKAILELTTSELSGRNEKRLAEFREGVESSLSKSFDSDSAGIFLIDYLFDNFQKSLLVKNTRHNVLSVQKKLNVMYIDSELIFELGGTIRNAYFNCSGEGTKDVYLRKEAFFISFGQYGYLVRMEVPSCDRRGDASNWASRWINGLRIALE